MPVKSARLAARTEKGVLPVAPLAQLEQDATMNDDTTEAASSVLRTSKRRGRPPKHLISTTDYTPISSPSPNAPLNYDKKRKNKGKETDRASPNSTEVETGNSKSRRVARKKRSSSHEQEETSASSNYFPNLDAKEPLEIKICHRRTVDSHRLYSTQSDTPDTTSSSSSLSLSASSLTSVDPSSNEDSSAQSAVVQSNSTLSLASSTDTSICTANTDIEGQQQEQQQEQQQQQQGDEQDTYHTPSEELATLTPPAMDREQQHSKLPVAVFRKITDQDQFYKDAIQHDDSSDDDDALIPTEKRDPIVFTRPEDHLIKFKEPTEQELINTVEYDMDEQDAQWLKLLNKERKKQKTGLVTAEFFEAMIDHIEKEWFNLVKDLPKKSSEEQTFPEDIQCAVCDDSECENSNAIVFCDGCNIAVHQDCYGIPYIPEGQWLCRKCMVSPEQPVSCIFCLNEGGAFKQTTENQWGHLVCAMWIPEVGVGNSVYMEPIDNVDLIPKSRWKLTCFLCRKGKGKSACIQCDNKHCFTAFHVTCARWARLCMRMKLVHGSGASGGGGGSSSITASTTTGHRNMNAMAAAKGLELAPAAQQALIADSSDGHADEHEAGGDNVVLKAYCDKHTPKDYKDEVDVEACVLAAQEWHMKHKTTMPRTRYVDEPEQSETTPESDDEDMDDDGDNEFTDIEDDDDDDVAEQSDTDESESEANHLGRKKKKGRLNASTSSARHQRRQKHRKRSSKGKLLTSNKKKAALAHRHQYRATDHDGAPIAPQFLIDSLENLDFVKAATDLRKKPYIIEQICRYWSMKRRDRRGAPLLKRLHLEPWTASASELMETEVEKAHKAAYMIALRADIERVRLLTEQVQKREKLKLDRLRKQKAYLDLVLYPIGYIIQTVLEQLIELDKKEFFRYPVTPELASDYYDIINTPMSFQDIIDKTAQHQYLSLDEFEQDLDLIWKNCMAYNKTKTIYYRTAQKLQTIAEGLLERAKNDYFSMRVNSLTGMLDIHIGQGLFSYGLSDSSRPAAAERSKQAQVAETESSIDKEAPDMTVVDDKLAEKRRSDTSKGGKRRRAASAVAGDEGKTHVPKKRRVTRSSTSGLNQRELRSRPVTIQLPNNEDKALPVPQQQSSTRKSRTKNDSTMEPSPSVTTRSRSTRAPTSSISSPVEKPSATTTAIKQTEPDESTTVGRQTAKKRRLEGPAQSVPAKKTPSPTVSTSNQEKVNNKKRIVTRSRSSSTIPKDSTNEVPEKENAAPTRRTSSRFHKENRRQKEKDPKEPGEPEENVEEEEATATAKPRPKQDQNEKTVAKKKNVATATSSKQPSIEPDFTDGSIVWAKVKSFPSHPAKIVDTAIKKNKVPENVMSAKPGTFKSPVLVTFFEVPDHHRWGWVEKEDISSFGNLATDVMMLQQAKKSKRRHRIQEVRKGYAYACRLMKKDSKEAEALVFAAGAAEK